MNVDNANIIKRYKEVLAEANHQVICYQLAILQLESEIKNLKAAQAARTEEHEE